MLYVPGPASLCLHRPRLSTALRVLALWIGADRGRSFRLDWTGRAVRRLISTANPFVSCMLFPSAKSPRPNQEDAAFGFLGKERKKKGSTTYVFTGFSLSSPR